jgi:uracil-DNA glycosylase family 4
VSREEAAALARHLAAHLAHLRQFRGLAYVGAAPLPRRSAVDWPEGQVGSPSGEPVSRPGTSGTSASPTASPAGAMTASATRPGSVPADLPSARVAGAPRDLETTRSPRPVERAPWPLGQVNDAHAGEMSAAAAERGSGATDMVAPAPVRLPVAPAGAGEPQSAGPAVRDQARTWSAAEKLDYLRRKNLGNCQRCKLAGSRTHIVFGVGNPEAELMFIGEAPGFDEDREGVPFVGAAGRRLTQWLGRLGLGRDQVYIANVLKCRPPGNRDPEPDEVERCSPFLRAQIRAIAPRVIVALGRHAGMLLLGGGDERTLREMRGRSWAYRDPGGAHEALLYVTYHPSYVIRRERELPPGQRNPADDTVMADLQQAMQKLRSA